MSLMTFRGNTQSSALSQGSALSQLRFVEAAGANFLTIENGFTSSYTVFQSVGASGLTEVAQGVGTRIVGRIENYDHDHEDGAPEFIFYNDLSHEMGWLVVQNNGQYGPPQALEFSGLCPNDVTAVATMSGTGPEVVLIVSESGGMRMSTYAFTPQKSLASTTTNSLQPLVEDGHIAQLESVVAGSTEFLLSLNSEANKITAYTLNPLLGLSIVGQIGANEGLGINSPTEFEIVEIGHATFVVITSTISNSISVVRLLDNGVMAETDHVIDSIDTHFYRTVSSELVTVNGRALIITAGSDGGITVLELLPNGRLTHIESTGTSILPNFGNVVSLVAELAGPEIQVYMLLENSDEITQISLTVSDLAPPQIGGLVGSHLQGSTQNDLLYGGGGNDIIFGGDGDDIIIDGYGSDDLYGGTGADIFVLTLDHDVDRIVDFNPQQDILDFSEAPQIYSVNDIEFLQLPTGARLLIEGVALDVFSHDGRPLNQSDFSFSIYVKLTHAPGTGSWSGDVVSGSAQGDTLLGSLARDLIYANDGDDVVILGGGDDRAFGGAGNDRLEGGLGNDWMTGEGGNDTLFGGPTGNDTLIGGDGDDMAFGQNGRDLIVLGAGDDTAAGGSEDDRLEGGFGEDTLRGDAGDDTLFGGYHADTMAGGDGIDRLYGEHGNDHLTGGSGRDYLFGGVGNDVLAGGFDGDMLHGEDGDDTLFGGRENDLLSGGGGSDRLFGEDGYDILVGGGAVDYLIGGADDDRLEGGAEGDVLRGGTQNDLLFGGTGNDHLFGEDDNDVLYGETGADRLTGGRGNDTLSGGADGDEFIFADGFGADTIIDYEVGLDVINLIYVLSITTFDDLVTNHLTYSLSGATILAGVDMITLNGVGNESLTEQDFLL